ncbi:MAG: hypothetical protein ACJAZS_000300 [Alteromonas naphthalenivorans]|jgi:hypothetical protein
MKKMPLFAMLLVILSLFASSDEKEYQKRSVNRPSCCSPIPLKTIHRTLKKSSSLGCIPELLEQGQQSDDRTLKECPLSGSHLPTAEEIVLNRIASAPGLIRYQTETRLDQVGIEPEEQASSDK